MGISDRYVCVGMVYGSAQPSSEEHDRFCLVIRSD